MDAAEKLPDDSAKEKKANAKSVRIPMLAPMDGAAAMSKNERMLWL